QRTLQQFIEAPKEVLLSELSQSYAADGFSSQYTSQTKAWVESLDLLQRDLRVVSQRRASACQWTILLEYPLYRLRRRIDAIVLTEDVVVVIEIKSGEKDFLAADKRQVEEYA